MARLDKEDLKILVIDRSWKEGEKPVPFFEKAYVEEFNVVIFPLTEQKNCTEVIFFRYRYISWFQSLFHISIDYDMDGGDPFYDFDLEDIDEQTFYDILDQDFNVLTSKLSKVEQRW
jgi:hypothetical protein